MPELPEVEATRRLLLRHAQGQRVTQVIGGDDAKIFERGAGGGDGEGNARAATTRAASPADVRAAFLGRTVNGAGRLGKHFYLDLSGGGPTPVMHLGMTGQVFVKTAGGAVEAPAYARDVGNGASGGGGGSGGGASEEEEEANAAAAAAAWPPRFCKLELVLASGARVALCDARRFGRVRLVPVAASGVLSAPPLSQLGFDPLLAMPPRSRLRALLARRRSAKLKALLLDQAFCAGVGNWVADEVLWQARLHPEQNVGELLEASAAAAGEEDEDEDDDDGKGGASTPLARLHAALRGVCETACAVEADSSRFPAGWLFAYRWTGGKSTTMPAVAAAAAAGQGGGGGGGGQKQQQQQHRIEFITAGGRTTAYVPALQRLLVVGRGGGAKKKASKGELEEEEGEEDDGDGGEEGGGGKRTRGGGGGKRKARRAPEQRDEVKDDDDDEAAPGGKANSKRQKKNKAAAAAPGRRHRK